MKPIYKLLFSLLGLVIILFAIINYFKQINLRKQLIDRETVYVKVKMESQKKDSIINILGKTVSQQKSLITDNKVVINTISNEVFNLKKKDGKNVQTLAYWNQVTTTKFDTIKLVYRDTVLVNSPELKGTIKVPKIATIDSPDYKIEALITKENLEITKLAIPDTLSFRIVEKKNGLFKPNTISFQSNHSNKFIQSTQESSLYYKPKPSNKLVPTLIKIGIGLVAGFYLAK